MPYYNRDPTRDHNLDNRPNVGPTTARKFSNGGDYIRGIRVSEGVYREYGELRNVSWAYAGSLHGSSHQCRFGFSGMKLMKFIFKNRISHAIFQ